MSGTDNSPSPGPAPTPENIVRDDKYYIEDGDCVIRAGNYLFKVEINT
jgi:hypothetical protein